MFRLRYRWILSNVGWHTNVPPKLHRSFQIFLLSPRADWYTTNHGWPVGSEDVENDDGVEVASSVQCRIVASPHIDHQPPNMPNTHATSDPEPHSHIDIVYFHLWQLFDKEHIAADFEPKVIKILWNAGKIKWFVISIYFYRHVMSVDGRLSDFIQL